MSATNNLTAGLDPTGEASLTASELLQMIQLAAPTSTRWIGYVGSSAPNTTDNPELIRGIWLDNTTPTDVQAKYHNGTSWVALPVAAGAVSSAAKIADSIITLAKLAASELSGKGGYLLRAKSDESGYELVAASSIFSNNSLPVAKLTKGTEGYFARSGATGVEWAQINFATEINALTDQINPNVLQSGGVTNKVLQTNSSGVVSFVTASDIFNSLGGLAIEKLNPGTGNANKVVRVKADGSAFEFSSISGQLTPVYIAAQTIPASDATLTFVHNQGKKPVMVQGFMVCTATDNGYAEGDRIPIDQICQDSDGLNFIGLRVDDTNVYAIADWNSQPLKIRDASTGDVVNFTQGKWNLLINCIFAS